MSVRNRGEVEYVGAVTGRLKAKNPPRSNRAKGGERAYRQQEPPNAVQIELAEGCNLRCTFCGLSGIREPKKNDYKFMESETLRILMSEMVDLGWNPRIEFAMHGEPTMHPDYVGMVRLARELAPRWHIMMTSNGGGLLRKPGPWENIISLFEAGLSVLALDDYEGVGIVPKIRATVQKAQDQDRVPAALQIYEYPEQDAGNPHRRISGGHRILSFVASIDLAKKGTHATLNNHAGAGAPPNDRGQGKRCAKPFRELSVRHDGSVAVCCNDWRGVYRCGNVREEGVHVVWNGDAMSAARVKLYHGQRDFGPCAGCDAVSYRVGLLPDKLGKESLPLPDARIKRDVATACSGPPLTPPVLRPWEKQP